MTTGSSSIRTIADTGLEQSRAYALNQQSLEAMGFVAGGFIQPQVEMQNVAGQLSQVELESNFFVPPSKSLASFAPPFGFSNQRRGLFDTAISRAMVGVGGAMNDLLGNAVVSNRAQETQKQTLINSFSVYQKLESWLTTVRNQIGRLRQG